MNKITEYDENGKPVAGRYTWEVDGSPEFTDEQLDRLDKLQQAAVDFLNVLSETDDTSYMLMDIWDLINLGAKCLTENGRRVRVPTKVTTMNGKTYITDWWEET